uniref:Uncharacterized protein n=1 Tax=Acrobeloides nanus TaxID=290746 RepID=A0A914D319_9BILA
MDTTRRIKRYANENVTPVNRRSVYESKIGGLERSLSRERYEKDRLRNQYTAVASQLDQALKQLDLSRSASSYALARSASQPRTSVFSSFFPHY